MISLMPLVRGLLPQFRIGNRPAVREFDSKKEAKGEERQAGLYFFVKFYKNTIAQIVIM